MGGLFEGGTVTDGDMDVTVCGREGWFAVCEDMEVGL